MSMVNLTEMADAPFVVEVAYALPRNQTLLTLSVDPGCVVRDVILRSGILQIHPDIDLHVNRVGLFGRLVTLTQAVRPGDRVEIYRPLIADPKDARKQRASKQTLTR